MNDTLISLAILKIYCKILFFFKLTVHSPYFQNWIGAAFKATINSFAEDSPNFASYSYNLNLCKTITTNKGSDFGVQQNVIQL
jgi:hypothetical protein